MKLVLFILLLSVRPVFANHCMMDASISNEARSFMLENGLIHSGDESIGARWGIFKTTPFEGTCLYVMQVCPVLDFGDGEEMLCTGNQTSHFEVIVKKKQFITFEMAFKIPASIKLAFGNASPAFDQNGVPVWTKDFYYVELFNKQSVSDSLKAIYSKFPYSGFSADISARHGTPDGKLPFDPTLGREWKVINAKYSLRRGATAEIHDVRSGHLDDNFEDYFRGSAGHIAPWGNAVPMKLYDQQNHQWVDVNY